MGTTSLSFCIRRRLLIMLPMSFVIPLAYHYHMTVLRSPQFWQLYGLPKGHGHAICFALVSVASSLRACSPLPAHHDLHWQTGVPTLTVETSESTHRITIFSMQSMYMYILYIYIDVVKLPPSPFYVNGFRQFFKN